MALPVAETLRKKEEECGSVVLQDEVTNVAVVTADKKEKEKEHCDLQEEVTAVVLRTYEHLYQKE